MPVGGSVDEGVVIFASTVVALRPSARCLYEAVEHWAAACCPRAFCVRPARLAARALLDDII